MGGSLLRNLKNADVVNLNVVKISTCGGGGIAIVFDVDNYMQHNYCFAILKSRGQEFTWGRGVREA